MFEIIYDAFSVQVVHGSPQEIPIQRPGKRKILRSTRNVCDGDDLFEGNDLNSGNNYHHVYVPGEHRDKEEGDHNQCPYCPGNECLLFLLVIGGLIRWNNLL